ncbi:MAG: hypothetical protein AAF415_02215 [Pseudomonadota bacterium]
MSFWTKRTGKRELSVGLVIFWIWMTHHLFTATPVENVAAYMPLYSTATMVIWGFTLAAFGMDAASKQLGLRLSRPQKPEEVLG